MSQTDFILAKKYIMSSSLHQLKCHMKSKRMKASESDPYDKNQTPLLFYAIKYATKESTGVLNYFLNNLSDLTKLQDLTGCTSLLYALESGNTCATDILLFHHSAPLICSTADNQSMTPILLSCKLGLLSVVEKLIEIGALFDQPDKEGSTPLHYAASYGNIEIAAYLIQKGADVYAVNKRGWAPIDYSYSNSVSEYIKACQLAVANGSSVPKYNPIQNQTIPTISFASSKASVLGTDFKSFPGIGVPSRANSIVGQKFTLSPITTPFTASK